MKFTSNQDKYFLIRKALFLRYGIETHNKKKDELGQAILPVPLIAKLLKIPEQQLKDLIRQHFKNLENEKRWSLQPPKLNPSSLHPSERVTLWTATKQEVDYITDQKTLQEQAALSLKERCHIFHRQFPNRVILPNVLSKIMKSSGITKKKIQTVSAPQMKQELFDKHAKRTIELWKEIQRIQNEGGHLIFADECVFKARGYNKNAWSNQRANVLIEDRTGKQPCQAVCAAVCKCHGLVNIEVTDYSFTQEKFESFLNDLRAQIGGDETIYLFLDNSRVHPVYERFEKLNIVPVWNVPYRFEFNAAVEKYWRQIKEQFRKILLQKMIEHTSNQDKPLNESVRQAIALTSTESIPKYVDMGLKSLEEEANRIQKALNWQEEDFE